MSDILNTLDLFAGCGGLTEGFLQSGHYRTLAAVEWEREPCDTLRHRLHTAWGCEDAQERVIRFDIQRSDELIAGFADPEYGTHRGLEKLIGSASVDVIIGGPPCQAYSLAGRIRDENGMRNDYRNYLFECYVKIVSYFRPKFFVFENVVGLLSAAPDGGKITDRISTAFRDAGYVVTRDFKDALFDVADFGVPQHRRRVVIVGVSEAEYGSVGESMLHDFYGTILPSMRRRHRSVKDAIGDLPPIYPLEAPRRENGKNISHAQGDGPAVANHIPRFHSQRDIGVFRLLAEDIKSGRMEYVGIDRLKKLYTEVTGKESNIHKYYVLREDEPSNTIPAHLYKDGMRHIHPDPAQARSITPREAARLQTFPDSFEFQGAGMHQFKMIGNAVPVEFARVVGEALFKLISGDYQHGRIFH